MVAVAISLVVTLAITGLLWRNESFKRTTTALNDTNQTGNYTSYVLDRALRSAGSGFAQRSQQAYGCLIRASRSGVQLLPRTTPFPDPFTTVATGVRLAPALIFRSPTPNGSDTVLTMAGTAGYGESFATLLPPGADVASVRLQNNLGFRANDLVLVNDANVGCMIQQVAPTFPTSPVDHPDMQTVPFGGDYYSASTGGLALTAFTSGALVQLGNVDPAQPNPPQFTLFGVDANQSLVTLDLLTGTNPAPIADNVLVLRAIYGIDNDLDGAVDSWVDPGVAPYRSSDLLDGSATAQENLRRIKAVRVGMVLRSALTERAAGASDPSAYTASSNSFTLFQGIAPQTITIAGDELNRRHRTLEFVVPLRNALLAP